MTLHAPSSGTNATASTATGDTPGVHAAVIRWLDANPGLPVKYRVGDRWWMTDRSRRDACFDWHALIQTTRDGGLSIAPVGRGRQVIGTSVELSARLAGLADPMLFDHLVSKTVADVLTAVEATRRQTTTTHRRAGRFARVARALAGRPR